MKQIIVPQIMLLSAKTNCFSRMVLPFLGIVLFRKLYRNLENLFGAIVGRVFNTVSNFKNVKKQVFLR